MKMLLASAVFLGSLVFAGCGREPVAQTARAGGLMSKSTRHVLESGSIFKLDFELLGKAHDPYRSTLHQNDVYNENRDRFSALREINNNSALAAEARRIIEAHHGADKLRILDNLLEFDRAAESLDIELNSGTAPTVLMAVFGKH